MTWLYAIGGIVGGIVVLFAGLVAWFRIGQARHVGMLKGAIREYAEAKGASVSFDANGFTVRGPRGEGYERMTSILIMCQPKDRRRCSPRSARPSTAMKVDARRQQRRKKRSPIPKSPSTPMEVPASSTRCPVNVPKGPS